MPIALEINALRKHYASVQAVDSLSLRIEAGELFGLIGPDGAGKTTTMRAVCGLVRPDGGSISVFGRDPVHAPRSVRELIGYMPQRFSLYPDLTVSENLRFFADLYLVPTNERKVREARLLEFSRLGPFKDRRAGQLSGGMKQKLALSCTLIHTPRLLILDEPTTGVDPVSRKEFWNIMRELRAEGIALLVSTPYMDEALLCDRIALMNKGSILASGTPQEVTDFFPDKLIVVTADEIAPVHQALITAGIDPSHIHRFGSRLHVTGKDAAQVSIAIKAAQSAGAVASPTNPSIEDTFVALLSRDEAAI